MPLPKPTLVFVSGAFLKQDFFEPVIPWLRRTGYPLNFEIELPSVGNNSASTVQEDADVIRNKVLDVLDTVDDGNNIIMVLFSYAAVPAAQGLVGLDQKTRGPGKTAILKLLFISCNMPMIGESHRGQYMKWAKSQGLNEDPPVEVKNGVATFIASPEMLYNGLDEEIMADLYVELKTQSAVSLMEPITQAAYLTIPSWYLVSKLDNLMPRDFQLLCTKVVGKKLENVEEIEAGHCSLWTRPELVIDYILRGARSTEKGYDETCLLD